MGLGVTEFSQIHVIKFSDYLLQVRKVSNRTCNNYVFQLRTVFNVMIERQYITANPVKGVKKLPTEIGKNIAFSPEQREKLERHLLNTDKKLYLFTRFVYYCFIRPGELLQIKLSDVDLENKRILIRANISKNRKQQAIPKVLFEMIEQLEINKFPSDNFLFGRSLEISKYSLHRNRVSERHKQALIETGLDNKAVTLYSWKHTGAVAFYRKTKDLKKLQKQLRHSSLEMTDIYLKSLGLDTDKDIENMDW